MTSMQITKPAAISIPNRGECTLVRSPLCAGTSATFTSILTPSHATVHVTAAYFMRVMVNLGHYL